MQLFREKIDALLRAAAREAGVELYHWDITGDAGKARMLVHIDRPEGVGLADCERASRAMSVALDREDVMKGPYVLEVSSPGIERRLWEPWHYERAVGKRIRLRLRTPHERGTHVEGRLVGMSGEDVLLASEDREHERFSVALGDVVRAHIVFEPDKERN